MKKLFLSIFTFLLLVGCNDQTLEEAFNNPPQDAKPLMIWQWMDGLLSAEGITADLEAYSEAGIGGVQQFIIGGKEQVAICDTTNAIGTENWKKLMRHAIDECSRLGLSFGTHNCPGWSSSAYPTVLPEYSMQKLVWRDTVILDGGLAGFELRQPDSNPDYPYYRDVAMLAMPAGEVVKFDDIKNLTDVDLNAVELPEGEWRIVRIGHTSNGKTNWATAAEGGVGLECDKMSREAVLHFWESYPALLFEIAGDEVGRTFQRLEIDSYEAGPQDWTPLMPEEFQKRQGYDIIPWLAAMTGVVVESEEQTKKFNDDFVDTVTSLFAENYYGYLAELSHERGIKLLYQPYATNHAVIDTDKITELLPNDLFCTEFWTNPITWGWPQVPDHMQVAHRHEVPIIYAESFTCWPLAAWKDDPASLKPLADKAYCLGVNRLMLHAGAQNPWPNAVPGMTFGKWGTQWTPGQTWWKNGAKALFSYFGRCQALLQRGKYVDDYTSQNPSLTVTDDNQLQWTHRIDGDADIYFVANPLDSAITTTVAIDAIDRLPEIWYPETGETTVAEAWHKSDDKTLVTMQLNEHESLFIILRKSDKSNGPGLTLPVVEKVGSMAITGSWQLNFPEGWGAPESVVFDSLTPWDENSDSGIKYFSGTAKYVKTINIENIDAEARYMLDLGTVKNLAMVYVNGQLAANLWKKPFRCDITDLLNEGDNLLEIEVTNLWPNRMIGDEQWPDDIEWNLPPSYNSNSPMVGALIKSVPDWLRLGEPRPEQNRKTVVSFKFFGKNSPLLPSGLLGPVNIDIEK